MMPETFLAYIVERSADRGKTWHADPSTPHFYREQPVCQARVDRLNGHQETRVVRRWMYRMATYRRVAPCS